MSSKKMELTENESILFEYIKSNNIEEIRQLLSTGKIRIDCIDATGMTPLQHAAFKSNLDVCKLLLSSGANVNHDLHEKKYTALMFAVLAGNKPVTQLLLEAGAKSGKKNCLGRTASQMAAFVGQYQCVSLINNYFDLSELAYYNIVQGFEDKPKLSHELLNPLYKFIIRTNLSPVGISIHLRENQCLLVSYQSVTRVLDLLLEKNMKGSDVNHIMAIKFHYLSCVLTQCGKAYTLDTQSDNDNKTNKSAYASTVTLWIKSNELLLRGIFSKFPYLDCPLIQQIIQGVCNVQIGDEPTSYSVLTTSINGQRYLAEDEVECNCCSNPLKNPKKCSKCKLVNYCDRDCQLMHWAPVHKSQCVGLSKMYACNVARQIEEERKFKEEEERKNKEEEERKEKEEEERKEKEEDGRKENDDAEENVEKVMKIKEDKKDNMEMDKKEVEKEIDLSGDSGVETPVVSAEQVEVIVEDGTQTRGTSEAGECEDASIAEVMHNAVGQAKRENETNTALSNLKI